MLCFGLLVLLASTLCVEALSPTEQEILESIASAQPNMNYDDKVGFTPLHAAAEKCHLDIVQNLLDFGANTQLRDINGNTPLHLAVACPQVLSRMIEVTSDVNPINKNKETPLHVAVRKKEFDSIRLLVRNGAVTNLTAKEEKIIVDTVGKPEDSTIFTLLTRVLGGNLDLPRGETTVPTSTGKAVNAIPITLSSIQEPVTVSTKRGIPEREVTTEKVVDTTPMSTLRTVRVMTKRPILQRVILKKPSGKEIQLQDAARGGMEGKIVDLCTEGMDPNFGDVSDNNFTPLHLATMAQGYAAMLTLIACGAKVDTMDREGNTPLHIATMRNDSWGAAVLLMRGADPYIEQRNGKTAYQIAKENRDIGTLSVFDDKLLEWYNDVRPLTAIEKDLHTFTKMGRYASGVAKSCLTGVNVNIKDADNMKRTALHIAVSAQYNSLQTVQMLVRCGGNVNARDAEGNTPLHLAAIEGKDTSFTALLLHKADPFMVNHEGKTAHQLSGESKSEYIKYVATFGSHRYHWFMNNKFL